MSKYNSLVLRVGLGLVLLWFGISEVINPVSMQGYIPSWFRAILFFNVNTFIFLNGVIEILLAVLLILGLFTRLVAILTALHLLAITIAVGYNEIGVRDFGLFMAALSLALMREHPFSLDNKLFKR